MIDFSKKIKAFTMAEVMVVMVIIAIISLATYGILKAQTNSATRYQYYSAFMNLKQAAGELLADGYTLADDAATPTIDESKIIVKKLPNKGYKVAPPSTTDAVGFCNRLIELLNITAATNCTLTTAPAVFDDTTLNFTTTNGTRYYGFGVDPTSSIFNVYIDIDGTRGTSKPGKDVMHFLVDLDGNVYPYYNSGDTTDSDGSNTSNGAINTNYLTASVQYRASDGSLVIVDNRLPYINAVCEATNAYSTIGCSGVPASVTAYNNNCNTTTFPGRYCEVVINKPKF